MNDQKKPLEWVVVKDVTDEATGLTVRISRAEAFRPRFLSAPVDELVRLRENFTESLIATVRATLHGAMADAMAAQLGEEPKVVRRRGIGQVGRMLRKAAKRVKAKAKAKTTERLARRSPEDLAKLEDRIAKFVAKHPEGSRAEDIRDSLGLVTKEMPLPLANLLDAGRLRKKGEKRATTYFATKKR